MSTSFDRRTFLALLGVGTVSATALAGLAEAMTIPAGATGPAVRRAVATDKDGVVRLGQSYLAGHPDEADPTKLRSLLPGLDAAQPVRPQLPAMVAPSIADFEAGRIVFVDGWHLALTEARASAAVALGV